MGTYTPKGLQMSTGTPCYQMHEPTYQPEVSETFFVTRQRIKDRVGPASYECIPNIQKFNHTARTFTCSLRRFKFNDQVEAKDKILNFKKAKDIKRKSVFDWKQIHLTGMQGKPSPGPGEYVSPSEFGQYISEKFVMS